MTELGDQVRYGPTREGPPMPPFGIASRCVLPHRRDILARTETVTPEGWSCTTLVPLVTRDHTEPRTGAFQAALLCTGHLRRLREIVASTPATVGWVRQHVVPGRPARDDTTRAAPRGKRTPAPIGVDAVDAVDHEAAVLASWCQAVAEERQEIGPDMYGTRRQVATHKDTHGHARPTDGERKVIGLRHGGDTEPVDGMVVWLLHRLDWVAQQPWVDEMVTELADTRGRTMHRWSIEDDVLTGRALPGLVCDPHATPPGCGHATLRMYPPSRAPVWTRAERATSLSVPVLDEEGRPTGTWTYDHDAGRLITEPRAIWAEPIDVSCSTCSRVVPPSEWDQLVEAAREVQRIDASARRPGRMSA